MTQGVREGEFFEKLSNNPSVPQTPLPFPKQNLPIYYRERFINLEMPKRQKRTKMNPVMKECSSPVYF